MTAPGSGAGRVIASLDQLTPGWLTQLLQAGGALEAGRVETFEHIRCGGNWSASARLRPVYSLDARGERPEKLFLKMVDTDLGDEFFGPSEVFYYTRDYVDVPDAPLLRCYHGAYDEAIHRYHLLLEDVTETHIRALEKQPGLAYGLALAEGLAALHARWWGARRLAQAGAPVHGPGHIRRFIEIAEPGGGHIQRELPDRLAPHWPALISSIFEQLPAALVARSQDLNGFTLIHGDAGDTNILVPRQGERPLYIIDRQPFDWSLTTWLGAYDLAYAIVLDWPVEARRRLEVPILRHYHRQLEQAGVRDYPWKRLWDDYRLSAALGVTIGVEYCRGGINARQMPYWLSSLQRALTACDDLDIPALWLPAD